MESGKEYLLEVPVDASQVADLKPNQTVKVVAYPRQGDAQERVVKLSADGNGVASFSFSEAPGSVQVALGPETATAAELKNLQTITVNVPASSFLKTSELRLDPVAISTYYWRWWLRWCRSFKVTGRLLCADGSPVVGATVSAYDVDAWWWWVSQDLVGTAVTDATGSFEIDFTRCCGWWPWFWWDARFWQVDPWLVETISSVVKQNTKVGRLAAAVPAPSLDVFNSLLASSAKVTRSGLAANVARPAANLVSAAVDPQALSGLREQLIEVLPKEFPLPIWPWYPWFPWQECGANLIFKATQICSGQTQTIVAETVANTRWDVADNLNVTLTANDSACCAYSCGENCPEGNCIVPTDICDINLGSIGGNIGAPAVSNAAQVGLYAPGVQDRPFGKGLSFLGLFGDQVNVDYYEFQYATAESGPYTPLPLPAVGGIDREILTITPGVPPTFSWTPVGFPPNPISDGTTTHYVIETIAHYEANNGVQTWDGASYDVLYNLISENTLANGTYYFRLVGYVRPGYTGNLTVADTGNPLNPGVLPVCDPNATDPLVDNYWVATLDNQAPGNTDPSSIANGGDQPCGLHQCTDQPASYFINLAILRDNAMLPIVACQPLTINCTDKLVLDFVAYDPDGFLDTYTLYTLYGLDESVDLLSVAGLTLTPSPLAPAWAPAAAQMGPSYGNALAEGATSPVWSGGAIRLTVPATSAFPINCAYLLQLNVYKRTIVDCNAIGDDLQNNLTYESFSVVVNCPAS